MRKILIAVLLLLTIGEFVNADSPWHDFGVHKGWLGPFRGYFVGGYLNKSKPHYPTLEAAMRACRRNARCKGISNWIVGRYEPRLGTKLI